MNRYWLSWYEKSEDVRPISFPPNKHIRGWWKSGETDNSSTLCAVVDAKSENEAWKAVDQDWPGDKEHRFCELKQNNYIPGDRFLPSKTGWEAERLDHLLEE